MFIKQPYFLLLVFSSFWRVLFGGLGEKTPRPHHLFFILPTQLNTYQKSFPFHFLSKVFHLPYFTYKQTHPKKRLAGGDQRVGPRIDAIVGWSICTAWNSCILSVASTKIFLVRNGKATQSWCIPLRPYNPSNISENLGKIWFLRLKNASE